MPSQKLPLFVRGQAVVPTEQKQKTMHNKTILGTLIITLVHTGFSPAQYVCVDAYGKESMFAEDDIETVYARDKRTGLLTRRKL